MSGWSGGLKKANQENQGSSGIMVCLDADIQMRCGRFIGLHSNSIRFISICTLYTTPVFYWFKEVPVVLVRQPFFLRKTSSV